MHDHRARTMRQLFVRSMRTQKRTIGYKEAIKSNIRRVLNAQTQRFTRYTITEHAQ